MKSIEEAKKRNAANNLNDTRESFLDKDCNKIRAAAGSHCELKDLSEEIKSKFNKQISESVDDKIVDFCGYIYSNKGFSILKKMESNGLFLNLE